MRKARFLPQLYSRLTIFPITHTDALPHWRLFMLNPVHLMKTKSIIISGALLLATASFSFAQNTTGDKPAGGNQAGQPPGQSGGNPDNQRRPHHNPLLDLFDTNHDGVIDADEIANASAVLKALDKNGDGKLTGDEMRPPKGPNDKKCENGPPPPPPDDTK